MQKFKYGAVASGHQLVTEIGLDILREGGNAFDAIVACGFAGSVCEPMLTSLGGGGFLLAHHDNKTQLFDFFSNHAGINYPHPIKPNFLSVAVNFPGSTQHFESGIASVATPGCLSGYFDIHKKLGRLPFRTVIQPTIELAKTGVKVSPFQHYVHSLLENIILSNEKSRQLFTKENQLIPVGELMFNHDLGDFLDVLSIEEPDLFYRGEVAQTIVSDMKNQGGFLTYDDLDHYQTLIRQPFIANQNDWTVYTNPPPSTGGILIGKLLSELNKSPPRKTLTEAGQHDWLKHFQTVDAWRQQLENENYRQFSRGTTHISVIDAMGNCAAMTTSNGEGSGYIAPNTGIMLNNMMGEDDLHPHGFFQAPAGTRIASMMSPTFAFHKNGKRYVLGTGGSKRIRNVITQILWQLMQTNLPLDAIINHPRLHFDGNMLQCEPGFERALDHASYWDTFDMYFGGIHAVSNAELPVADSRREGFASYQ